MTGVVIEDRPAARLEVAGLTLLERNIVAARRRGAGEIVIVSPPSAAPLPRFRRLGRLGIAPRIVASRAEAALDGAAVVDGARFVDIVVEDESTRAEAERRLWASLESSADGLVDRWLNRPLGRIFSKLLVRTEVSPNQITVAGTLIGLAGAAMIAHGGAGAAVAGALVIQVSAALDCVDGEIARVLFKESPLGKWLDISLDNLVHIAIFVAIAFHCARRGVAAPLGALAASACAGALLSFVVVVRGMRLSAEQRDPRVAAIVDRLTNRDFSVIVVALALAGRLEWFLWAAGTLVHVFWAAALLAQLAPGRSAARAAR